MKIHIFSALVDQYEWHLKKNKNKKQQWTPTRTCPEGEGGKEREKKIFTSTVYNIIYKYILDIN